MMFQWKETNSNKYLNVEKKLKSNIKENTENIIIINGSKEYINMMSKFIENFLQKNIEKYRNTKLFIMDFYEVGTFNENIIEILDEHEIIFNTSGEHKIEDVFTKETAKVN